MCTQDFLIKLSHRGLLNWIPDKMFIKLMYRIRIGKRLNLKKPQTFNEKLQWLKLYDRKPEYSDMVDKYEVKRYVAEKIGEQYIIPTFGVWEKFEDIDFSSLPNQFVLKCTHDSGGLVICRDKLSFNKDQASLKISKSLKNNYYWHGREWPYKNVRPRIIAEMCMTDESKIELKDYKVMCFNGKAKLIQVHKGRFIDHTQDFYDSNWNLLDIKQGLKRSDSVMPRPRLLDDMLKMSELLANGISQVRVDWYIVSDKLYFGEITFFDASGFDEFDPEGWNLILGDWISLPDKCK